MDTVYESNPRASGLLRRWGEGGHPRKTGTRKGSLGGQKSTEKRWPLPSSRARGSVMGVESEKAGWRAEELEGGDKPLIVMAIPAKLRGRFKVSALGRCSLLLGS